MYQCLVCGYFGLDEPPRNEAGSPSYDICPSCGFEYGYDDDDQHQTYDNWRVKWIDGGLNWWSKNIQTPTNWNPNEQLASLLL